MKLYLEINDKDYKLIKEILIGAEIQVIEKGPLTAFLEEEAIYRLQQFCENNRCYSEIEKQKFIEEHKMKLAEVFNKTDCIIDSDVLVELTNDYIEDNEKSFLVLSFEEIYTDEESVAPIIYEVKAKDLEEIKSFGSIVHDRFFDSEDLCPGDIFEELMAENNFVFNYIGGAEEYPSHEALSTGINVVC